MRTLVPNLNTAHWGSKFISFLLLWKIVTIKNRKFWWISANFSKPSPKLINYLNSFVNYIMFGCIRLLITLLFEKCHFFKLRYCLVQVQKSFDQKGIRASSSLKPCTFCLLPSTNVFLTLRKYQHCTTNGFDSLIRFQKERKKQTKIRIWARRLHILPLLFTASLFLEVLFFLVRYLRGSKKCLENILQ